MATTKQMAPRNPKRPIVRAGGVEKDKIDNGGQWLHQNDMLPYPYLILLFPACSSDRQTSAGWRVRVLACSVQAQCNHVDHAMVGHAFPKRWVSCFTGSICTLLCSYEPRKGLVNYGLYRQAKSGPVAAPWKKVQARVILLVARHLLFHCTGAA